MVNKGLIKKIGILTLSAFLLGSCAAQGHATANQECKNSKNIFRKIYNNSQKLDTYVERNGMEFQGGPLYWGF